MNLNIKKIGIRTGGFIGLFLVLIAAAYFIYPYLNPKEVKKIQQKNKPVANASYNSGNYSLAGIGNPDNKIKELYGAIDSLKHQMKLQQQLVDVLKQKTILQQQLVDSLNKQLQLAHQIKPEAGPPASEDKYNAPITEISKSLLSLDEEVLAPIVDLLEQNQLISLYRAGSTRQRKKLLRTLKPEKAAKILKKAM